MTFYQINKVNEINKIKYVCFSSVNDGWMAEQTEKDFWGAVTPWLFTKEKNR